MEKTLKDSKLNAFKLGKLIAKNEKIINKKEKAIKKNNRMIKESSKKIEKLENQLEKLEKELAKIELTLADQSLYEEANKEKLQRQLQLQAANKKELEQVESEWLQACEERDK